MQAIVERVRDAAYEAHTYKHTTMGFLKDIQDMPNQYQYSLTFFDRWYRPENCVVVVVGDFQQEKLVALAKKYYGAWKHGSYTLAIPAEPPQKAEKVIDMPWKSKTLPILTIAYHTPAFSDAAIDGPALDLFAQVVFSQTSDLYRKLVVEDQLTESVGGNPDESRDPGLFYVFARVKNVKNIPKVKEAILAAIEGAKTKPVSADRLASIKSHIKYEFAMGLDNADHVASEIGHYISLTNDPETVNKIYALYDKVTPEDIMAAANKYFGEQNRTALVLTQQAQEVKQ
jgi:zinc protease